MSTGKLHDGEVDTDVDLVRRLLASQLPQWADLPIESLDSTGTSNYIYRLGDDMTVRLPRIAGSTAAVAMEQRWLPKLAPHLPLAIPLPLASGLPGEGYPFVWSVGRWLEGGSAAAERDGVTRIAIDELQGKVDTDAATAAWEEALATPAWSARPVWIHGDLMPGNILVDRGRLHAVIDFGSLGVGDPACDLQIAWNFFTAESRDAYRAALDVDDATWARGRGWALTVALLQLPYYETSNPVMAGIARYTIDEVLADHARAG